MKRLIAAGCVVLAGCVTGHREGVMGWDFMDLNGTVHTGEICFPPKDRSVTVESLALENVPADKRTGVLFMWLGASKSKPYRICEYVNGEKHGYHCCFVFSRSGWSGNVGILRHGTYNSEVFFDEGKGIHEATIFLDAAEHVKRYIYFPEVGQETPSCFNFQYPKDGSPYIETYTNDLQRSKE